MLTFMRRANAKKKNMNHLTQLPNSLNTICFDGHFWILTAKLSKPVASISHNLDTDAVSGPARLQPSSPDILSNSSVGTDTFEIVLRGYVHAFGSLGTNEHAVLCDTYKRKTISDKSWQLGKFDVNSIRTGGLGKR